MEDRDKVDPPANTRSTATRGAARTQISNQAGDARKQAADGRPLEVPGPFGEPLTFSSLPSPDTRRWVVRRKAEVLAAINGGLLTTEEACARYRLSPEELELWQKSLDLAGVPGLRVTRIQLYRDYEAEKAARKSVGRTENSLSY